MTVSLLVPHLQCTYTRWQQWIMIWSTLSQLQGPAPAFLFFSLRFKSGYWGWNIYFKKRVKLINWICNYWIGLLQLCLCGKSIYCTYVLYCFIKHKLQILHSSSRPAKIDSCISVPESPHYLCELQRATPSTFVPCSWSCKVIFLKILLLHPPPFTGCEVMVMLTWYTKGYDTKIPCVDKDQKV